MNAWCIAIGGELGMTDLGDKRVWSLDIGRYTPSGPLIISEDKSCDRVTDPAARLLRDEIETVNAISRRFIEFTLDENGECRLVFDLPADRSAENAYERLVVSSIIVAGKTLQLQGLP